MIKNKRLWIGLMAIPISFASLLVISAQKAHLANAGGVIDPTCTSSSPCIEYDNNGSGPGIRGISVSGNGTVGETKFKSTSAANAKAAVVGVDLSLSGSFDSGVKGTSTRGFGVAGQSTSGSGVSGTSSSALGVAGTSTTGTAVQGISKSGIGVNAISTSSIAVQGFSSSGPGGFLFSISGDGLDTETNTGFGLKSKSTGSVGVDVVGGKASGVDNFPALSVAGNGTSNDLITACATADPCDDLSSPVFTVDIQGQVTTVGGLVGFHNTGNLPGVEGLSSGGTNNGVGVHAVNGCCLSTGDALLVEDQSTTGKLIEGFDTFRNLKFQVLDDGTVNAHAFNATLFAQRQPTSLGPKVTTYSHQSSMPTIEDFGEAMLTGGQTYVNLDRTFAAAIDSRMMYMVFLTPEGDTRGLYVTQKTPAGFLVRENQGGRSTVAFSYRIVARPYGSTSTRLALASEMIPGIVPARLPRHSRIPALHYVPKSKRR